MKQIIWLLFLMLTVTAASVSQDASARKTSLTSPKIVAKFVVTNATATIPQTALFTPAQSGLYRVSVYLSDTATNLSGWDNSWCWTDSSGTYFCTDVITPQINNENFQQQVFTFVSGANTPVLVALGPSSPPPDGTYTLWYVVEQLE